MHGWDVVPLPTYVFPSTELQTDRYQLPTVCTFCQQSSYLLFTVIAKVSGAGVQKEDKILSEINGTRTRAFSILIRTTSESHVLRSVQYYLLARENQKDVRERKFVIKYCSCIKITE